METHLYPRHLSEDFISKGKFILGLRNPKDTAVSLFHHLKRANRHFLGNWDELIECILDGEGKHRSGNLVLYSYNKNPK